MKKLTTIALSGALLLFAGSTYAAKLDTLSYNKFSPIASVNVSGGFTVNIKQGDKQTIAVKGTEKDLTKVTVTGDNGHLVVKDTDKSHWEMKPCCRDSVEVDITAKNLNSISLEGSNKLSIQGVDFALMNLVAKGNTQLDMDQVNFNLFNILTQGSISGALDGSFNQVRINNSGKSNLIMTGKTQKLDIVTKGSSNINSASLKADVVNINTAGSSNILLYADKTLNIVTKGKAKLGYYGAPKLNKTTSGKADIQKLSMEKQ